MHYYLYNYTYDIQSQYIYIVKMCITFNGSIYIYFSVVIVLLLWCLGWLLIFYLPPPTQTNNITNNFYTKQTY